MRSNKIRVRKTDHLRTMLTDTLPYEVPLLFSNEGFYKFLTKNGSSKFKDEYQLDIFSREKTVSIPYTYKIRKNSSEFRSLSVMHPRAQISVANFYKQYDSVMLALCQRSAWTLRAPDSVASHYVEKFRAQRPARTRTEGVEEAKSGFDEMPRTASSYFAYRKYNFLYKFFESTEFHGLEKKFKLLLKLDVSQCFARIYTHTIAWAIKSKDYAKAHRGRRYSDRFEDAFDRLMQDCNYGETAGIIIGPEVSRIFAEMILQRIDLDLTTRLEGRISPVKRGVHYEIRRYVDDYFVFANTDEYLEVVQSELSECLMEYKLSLNTAKAELSERPFSTSATSARIEIAQVISSFFDAHLVIADPAEQASPSDSPSVAPTKPKRTYRPKHMRDPEVVANFLIRDIKRLLKANEASFDSTANYLFGVSKRSLIRYLSALPFEKIKATHTHRVSDFLYALIEALFFFYSMVPRVRQTYQIAEICILIVRYINAAEPDIRERVTKKIIDEALAVMHMAAELPIDDNIEVLNLLIALRELGPIYRVSQTQLLKLLRIEIKAGTILLRDCSFGYFQTMTVLHYLGQDSLYDELRTAVSAHVYQQFKEDETWTDKAELVFLFLDYLRCPHIGHSIKIDLIKVCLARHSVHNINARCESLLQLVESQDWFFYWDGNINMEDILERKQLRTPY